MLHLNSKDKKKITVNIKLSSFSLQNKKQKPQSNKWCVPGRSFKFGGWVNIHFLHSTWWETGMPRWGRVWQAPWKARANSGDTGIESTGDSMVKGQRNPFRWLRSSQLTEKLQVSHDAQGRVQLPQVSGSWWDGSGNGLGLLGSKYHYCALARGVARVNDSRSFRALQVCWERITVPRSSGATIKPLSLAQPSSSHAEAGLRLLSPHQQAWEQGSLVECKGLRKAARSLFQNSFLWNVQENVSLEPAYETSSSCSHRQVGSRPGLWEEQPALLSVPERPLSSETY